MIRLTLLLIAGIAVTMYLYGDTSDLPQGSDPGGPDTVARADTDADGLLTKVSQLIDATTAAPQGDAERLPLADEKRAIEIALAATVSPSEPAAAPNRTVKLTGNGPPRPVQAASAEPSDLWVVTGSRVNLRAGPSTSESVVGQVREGQRAEVLEETSDGWFRIETADDGQSGFIYGQFLSPLDAG